MAQATSPSTPDRGNDDNSHPAAAVAAAAHVLNSHSDPRPLAAIDPSIATASNPAPYPPSYPYAPQPHDMSQYQGPHPPPPPQMYARPDWTAHGYGPPHGLPSPYGQATTVRKSMDKQRGKKRKEADPLNIRFIHLFRFLALRNISVPDVGMKRLSACTSVGGMDAKRPMAL